MFYFFFFFLLISKKFLQFLEYCWGIITFLFNGVVRRYIILSQTFYEAHSLTSAFVIIEIKWRKYEIRQKNEDALEGAWHAGKSCRRAGKSVQVSALRSHQVNCIYAECLQFEGKAEGKDFWLMSSSFEGFLWSVSK